MLKNKVVVEKAKTVLYLWYLLRKKKDLLKGNFARHLTNPPKNKSNDQNKIFHSKQFVYNQLKFVIFGVQNVQLLSRLFQGRFADLLGSFKLFCMNIFCLRVNRLIGLRIEWVDTESKLTIDFLIDFDRE